MYNVHRRHAANEEAPKFITRVVLRSFRPRPPPPPCSRVMFIFDSLQISCLALQGQDRVNGSRVALESTSCIYLSSVVFFFPSRDLCK